jgi:hypothetical protein
MEPVTYSVTEALRSLQVKARGLESQGSTAAVAENKRASMPSKRLDMVIGLKPLPHYCGEPGLSEVGREEKAEEEHSLTAKDTAVVHDALPLETVRSRDQIGDLGNRVEAGPTVGGLP